MLWAEALPARHGEPTCQRSAGRTRWREGVDARHRPGGVLGAENCEPPASLESPAGKKGAKRSCTQNTSACWQRVTTIAAAQRLFGSKVSHICARGLDIHFFCTVQEGLLNFARENEDIRPLGWPDHELTKRSRLSLAFQPKTLHNDDEIPAIRLGTTNFGPEHQGTPTTRRRRRRACSTHGPRWAATL